MSIYQFYDILYAKIQSSAKKPSQSHVISPFALHLALTLASMGATGQTADQMSKALGLEYYGSDEIANEYEELMESLKNHIQFANKVFVSIEHPINVICSQAAANKFHTEIDELDFRDTKNATDSINQWIEQKTEGHIKHIVSKLSENTMIIIVNAVSFIGDWTKPFEIKRTLKESFFVSEKKTVIVDLMSQEDYFHYAEVKDLDAKAVKLLYEGGLSMVIVLPNRTMGLNVLEKKLKRYSLLKLYDQLKDTTFIALMIPKFKIEFKIAPLPELQKMEMVNMSTNKAEFQGLIVEPEGVFIKKIIHKVCIEVNETGNIAPAAEEGEKKSTEGISSSFVADHPFKFFVQNDENLILFAGSFCGPLK